MTSSAAPTIDSILASARRLGEVKVSWLQTFVSVESYASYTDSAGVMGISSKAAHDRVVRLEKAIGYAITNDNFEATTSRDANLFKILCESLLGFLDSASNGKLYKGTDQEKRDLRNLSVEHFRTFVIVTEKSTRREVLNQLPIDESTLSRRLTDVERAFGNGELFENMSGIVLTAAGRNLLSVSKVFLKKFVKFKGGIAIEYVDADSKELLAWNVSRKISMVRNFYRSLKPSLIDDIGRVAKTKRSNKEKEERIAALQHRLDQVTLFDAELEKLTDIYPDQLATDGDAAGEEALKAIERIWLKEEALLANKEDI
jgi:hypothetical protein